MAEKIAQGVVMESPAYRRGGRPGGQGGSGGGAAEGDGSAVAGHDEAAERARFKRDSARGTVVLGVAMMFLGSGLGWAFAAGGAAMTLGGTITSIYWSRKLAALREDPWRDEEIDAWEQRHLEGDVPDLDGADDEP